MRSQPEIKVVVHYPSTQEGKKALSNRVAKAHTDAVRWYISRNVHNSEQREKLVDTIMASR